MKTFIRLFGFAVAFVAIGLSVTSLALAADKKPAPPRSTAELGSDLDDLDAQLNHLDKNIGTYDETQRRSIYAKLLAMAEKIGVGLAVQRNLLNQATGSQPRNDATGGLTKATTGNQKQWMADLNRLDARLAALRARLAAFNPDKPAGVGPRPGGGGGGGGTTVTPAGGAKKK